MIFRNCIVDMNARIGKNVVITNSKVSAAHLHGCRNLFAHLLSIPTLVLWPWVVPLFVTGLPRGWSPWGRVLHKVWNCGDLEECNHQGWVCHTDRVHVCLQNKNLQWYYIDGSCNLGMGRAACQEVQRSGARCIAWHAVPWTLVLLVCTVLICCPGSCSKPFMNLCIFVTWFGSTLSVILYITKISVFC